MYSVSNPDINRYSRIRCNKKAKLFLLISLKKEFFRFVERTSQKDYIHFISGTSCKSPLGRKGKRQPVRIGGCDTAGNVIHELFHTVGK